MPENRILIWTCFSHVHERIEAIVNLQGANQVDFQQKVEQHWIEFMNRGVFKWNEQAVKAKVHSQISYIAL